MLIKKKCGFNQSKCRKPVYDNRMQPAVTSYDHVMSDKKLSNQRRIQDSRKVMANHKAAGGEGERELLGFSSFFLQISERQHHALIFKDFDALTYFSIIKVHWHTHFSLFYLFCWVSTFEPNSM